MKIILILSVMFFSLASGAFGDNQDQKFQGFNLEGFADDGSKAWDVNGDTADILGAEIKLTNVDANSYGKQKLNITAKTGTINQTSGNMNLKEDVVITSEDGSQLLTESLNWDRNQDLVTTDDKVKIMDPRFSAYGEGMEAKPGMKLAQLNKDVTMYVDTEPESKEDKIVTITSDGPVVIDQLKGKATFEVNVVAVHGLQTLKADVMEVFFSEDMSTVKEMVCTGHVVILQGENKTTAEKAVYDAHEQKLTLSGRPKLIFLTEGEGAITSFGDEKSR